MYAILNYNPQLRPYTAELTQRVTHFQAASTTILRAGCTESGRRRRSSFG